MQNINKLIKFCSYVSVCQLLINNKKTNNNETLNKINTLIKSALFNSILGLNGYGGMFIDKNKNKNISNSKFNTNNEKIKWRRVYWLENCIVFLRIYYSSQLLEPKNLLQISCLTFFLDKYRSILQILEMF